MLRAIDVRFFIQKHKRISVAVVESNIDKLDKNVELQAEIVERYLKRMQVFLWFRKLENRYMMSIKEV